jgi:glycosyltransferase involved in cell wall biosynthesis
VKIRYFHHGLWPSHAPSTTFITYNALGFFQNGSDFELVIVRNSSDQVSHVLKNEFNIVAPLSVTRIRAGVFKRVHWVIYVLAFFHFLRSKCDVLITRNLGFLPFALLLRRLKRIKVVYEAHDFFADQKLWDQKNEGTKARQRRREKRYVPRVDAVICVSEVMASRFSEYFPGQRFVTAVSGIKTHLEYRARSSFTHTLGYLGTFSPRDYDLGFLLNVLSRVRDTRVRLLLVGGRNDTELRTVGELVTERGLSTRVEVLPWQSPVELETVKQRIDIGLSPMMADKRGSICSPLKVLEYLSAGIPVISTGLEGVSNIVQNGVNGYTLTNDADLWAATIDGIYADSAGYHSLSRGCLETALAFGWNQRAREIQTFLEANLRS